jgi:hypothetical protein
VLTSFSPLRLGSIDQVDVLYKLRNCQFELYTAL